MHIDEFGRKEWVFLAILTTLAAVMRFYRLDMIPQGLHFDEAFNGLDARQLVSTPLTDWPIFFTGNFGREPLFVWLLGIAHAFFGPSIWTVRSISALCGTLLTPALVWLGWELAPQLQVADRGRFSLWCGISSLALLWSQMFARYAIRPALFVLITVLLFASLWKAWRHSKRSIRWWSLAGVLIGLSFYTYLPARLLPLILILLLLSAFAQDTSRLQKKVSGLIVCTIIAVLVSLPLAWYFLQNPLSFLTRIDQVSLSGPDTGPLLLQNLGAAVGMFFWSGDPTPRANLPLRPVLDPLLILPFVFGLVVVLRRFWRPGQLFLLAGLVVLLLPTVLSDYAPHFQRAIGALPFTVLLIAYGWEGVMQAAEAVRPQTRSYLQAGVWVILLSSVALTNWTYFSVWANSPSLFAAWDAGFTRLANLIADDANRTSIYISPRGRDHPTVRYLLAPAEDLSQLSGFDGRICMRVSSTGAARYYFLTREDFRSSLLIDSYHPDSALKPVILDDQGEGWASVLDHGTGDPVVFPEMIPHDAQLADGIALKGYWLFPETGVETGQSLYVRLFWHVERAPAEDYTAFAHLLVRKADGSFEQITGRDRPPGDGTCPTTEWRPGEMVIDELELAVPADLADGERYLGIGFYSPDDGQRVVVDNTLDNQVLIGPLP